MAESKGVYPQSDGGLAIVDIDASKGFVDLWVHLTFAIFANFDLKKQLKWFFDQDPQDRSPLVLRIEES